MTHNPPRPSSLDALISNAQQRTTSNTIMSSIPTSISTISLEDQVRARQSSNTGRKGRNANSPPRPHQVATTLSDAEYDAYTALVQASGLTRSNYIRILITNPGKVTIRSITDIDKETLTVLLQCASCLTEMRDAVRAITAATRNNAASQDDIRILQQHNEDLRVLAQRIYVIVEGLYGNY